MTIWSQKTALELVASRSLLPHNIQPVYDANNFILVLVSIVVDHKGFHMIKAQSPECLAILQLPIALSPALIYQTFVGTICPVGHKVGGYGVRPLLHRVYLMELSDHESDEPSLVALIFSKCHLSFFFNIEDEGITVSAFTVSFVISERIFERIDLALSLHIQAIKYFF